MPGALSAFATTSSAVNQLPKHADANWSPIAISDCTLEPEVPTALERGRRIREHFLREFYIADITKHAAKNVAASMFWLERRYPAEFALRVVNRQINSQEPVLDRVSPEQLIEDIRLAQQVANERVQLPSLAPGADGQD